MQTYTILMADPSDEGSSGSSEPEQDGKKKGWYTKWREGKAEKKKSKDVKKIGLDQVEEKDEDEGDSESSSSEEEKGDDKKKVRPGFLIRSLGEKIKEHRAKKAAKKEGK